MFELKLDAENRVVYASTLYKDGAEILVETIPENVLDYKYIDGEFIYDPLPQPDYDDPAPKPTQLDRVEAQTMYTAMLTDTLLEV